MRLIKSLKRLINYCEYITNKKKNIKIKKDLWHKNIYENKINEVQTKIEEITMVNINSPLQLSDYLFVENELPNKGIKKTTRGYSTDVTNLNKLTLY